MPQIVLDKLGTSKISINKVNGNGIGLYSAFNYLQRIGDDLKICNNKVAGAKISIKIPRDSQLEAI